MGNLNFRRTRGEEGQDLTDGEGDRCAIEVQLVVWRVEGVCEAWMAARVSRGVNRHALELGEPLGVAMLEVDWLRAVQGSELVGKAEECGG
jgi:hypothetical protein